MSNRDGMECKSLTVNTAAYIDQVGRSKVADGYGFVLDITNFNGAKLSIQVTDINRCQELIDDLSPEHLSLKVSADEDETALHLDGCAMSNRDGMEVEAIVVNTVAYIAQVGRPSIPPAYKFVLDILRFDGEKLTIGVLDIDRCCELIADFMPERLMVSCADGEDEGTLRLLLGLAADVTLH